jgi:hypothetical protein
MKRQKATELVQQVLARAVAGEWPANLVTEIKVFGSYMRGALEPADVDLAYKFDGRDDPRWQEHWHNKFFAGQDTMAAVRKSLRGTSRGISLTLLDGDGAGYEDIPMMVLWQKGEPLGVAVDRLAHIKPDASAGTAERHHMTEAFEGLDKYLPRAVRGELKQLEDAGAIRIRKVELADREEFDVVPTQINLDMHLYNLTLRWNEDSPLRRAAVGAISDIYARHGSLGNIELNGKTFHRDGSAAHTVFVDFKLRHIEFLIHYFLEEGCTEWIELLSPSTKGSLHALIIEPGDRSALGPGQVRRGFFR